MASTRDLRRRIKSVKNTAQITKAMQMVSATKMRRAQNQALLSRPYANLLGRVLALVARGELTHPLLSQNNAGKIGVVLFSTDKGLCGALNTNLFRLLTNSKTQEMGDGNVVFYTIGKKGRDFIVRIGKKLVADFENPDRVTIRDASEVSGFLINEFIQNQVGQVFLLYPDFISTLRQEPKLLPLLPIRAESLQQYVATNLEDNNGADQKDQDFLFEPGIDSLLDFALTHFVEVQVFKAYLETRASEHSARMIAMQNATNNASDLVADLTLTYNGVRQENITRELLEITSAGAALE